MLNSHFDETLMKEVLGSTLGVYGISVLIRAPHFPEKTRSGLILDTLTNDQQSRLSSVGQILGHGQYAFKNKEGIRIDHDKYEIGDWIIYNRFDRIEVPWKGKDDRKLFLYYVNDTNFVGKINPKDLETVAGDRAE